MAHIKGFKILASRALGLDATMEPKNRPTRNKGTGVLGDITNVKGIMDGNIDNDKELRRSKVCVFSCIFRFNTNLNDAIFYYIIYCHSTCNKFQ